jgi:hypothetical protein
MTVEFVLMDLRKVAKEALYQISFSPFMRGVKEKEYLVVYKMGAGNTISPPLLRRAKNTKP